MLVTNKAYTELASGLCVQGPDGTWIDAAPVINPDNVLGGASGSGGQVRVHFAFDANTAGWAVDLTTPDNKEFLSRVYGLSYWDSASGGNVLLAALQDCQGSTSGSDEWALDLNTSANTITLVTKTNGTGSNPVLSASASCLSVGRWTQIVLNYGLYSCALYTNGVLAATNSTGNNYWPSQTNRSLGMVIGNTTAYNASINGQFDELETFNYQLAASDIAANFQTVQAVDTDLNGIPDLLEDIQLPTNRPFLGAPVVIAGTVEAEQFDMGGPGIGYHNVGTHPTNSYRPTGMFITNCDDLGLGYCLDQTVAGEWTQYTINVLLPGTYMVETRAAGIGTNGAFEIAFATNGAIYTNTGPLVIPTKIWTNVSAVVTLTNGINVMKLSFLTNGMSNGISGTNVGRFNYISIYPWWPDPLQTNVSTNVPHLLSDDDSWYTSSNNAYWIQYAINGFPNGGVVSIPSGTYYVAQLSTNDVSAAYASSAMSVLANNMIIEGAGVGTGVSNTTLIAHNRATTIFSFGCNASHYNPLCTNLTLRDMTLVARPHLVFTNILSVNTNVYERGQLFDDGIGRATGNLVVFYGVLNQDPVPWQYTQNILVTNCTFLHAIQSISLYGAVSNCLVRQCTFTPWDLTNHFDGTTNTPPGEIPTADTIGYAGQEVGIMGGGNNIVIVENIYTNIGTVANTNNFQTSAPDGFVWLQAGGNAFIGRNMIGNYGMEAIQLNAGPSAVVGNVNSTVLNVNGCCGLCATGSGSPGLTGYGLSNYSTTYVGNWIYGGWAGEHGGGSVTNTFTLNFSGNYLYLFAPFEEVGSWPSAVAAIADCQTLNLCGNSLVSGGYGVWYEENCANALILDNNFSGVTYCGIGYMWAENSMTNAQIYRNILGEGVSFHVKTQPYNGFGWFLKQNQYLNGSANVPPFLDPVASSAHVSN